MFTNLPPVTKVLLIINGLVFLLELVLGQRVGLLSPFMLWPLQPGAYDALSGTAFMPWQLITYGFLHDPNNFAHLLFNMLALLMFGAPLEYTWGNRRFLTYYLRSEEPTSELQSLMRISYAVFCLKKKKDTRPNINHTINTTLTTNQQKQTIHNHIHSQPHRYTHTTPPQTTNTHVTYRATVNLHKRSTHTHSIHQNYNHYNI